MADESHDKRSGRMKALAAELPKIAGKALGRQGFAEAGLIADWAAIVGERMAEACLPLKLAFARGGERREGTLHLRVAGSAALELQHLEPQLIERINGYFGYRAVARLKYERGPLPRRGRPARPPEMPLDAAEIGEIEAKLAPIGPGPLRESLARFGGALRRRAKSAR